MKKIKNQIKMYHLVESEIIFFQGHLVNIVQLNQLLKKNRAKAINNFLDFLSDSIDWPKNTLLF